MAKERKYARNTSFQESHIIPVGYIHTEGAVLGDEDTDHLRHITGYGQTSKYRMGRFLQKIGYSIVDNFSSADIGEEDYDDDDDYGHSENISKHTIQNPAITVLHNDGVATITTDEQLIDMYKNKLHEVTEDTTPSSTTVEDSQDYLHNHPTHESISVYHADGFDPLSILDSNNKYDRKKTNMKAKNSKRKHNYRSYKDFQRRQSAQKGTI